MPSVDSVNTSEESDDTGNLNKRYSNNELSVTLDSNRLNSREACPRCKSKLQLFEYDLTEDVESKVDNYEFQEKDEEYLNPLFGKSFGELFIVYMVKKKNKIYREYFTEFQEGLKFGNKFMSETASDIDSGCILIDANNR